MTSGLSLFSGIGSHPRVVTSLVLCSLINVRLLCAGSGLSGSLGGPLVDMDACFLVSLVSYARAVGRVFVFDSALPGVWAWDSLDGMTVGL